MTTLDELKKKWNTEISAAYPAPITAPAMAKIIKVRMGKITRNSFQFFWASLTLQIIVYSLLSHVIFKYGGHSQTLALSIAGVVLYIPLTIMLMTKFKNMAKSQLTDSGSSSVYDYAAAQQKALNDFYRFKKRYELMLVPLSSLIAVYLIFVLYVPGGFEAHRAGAVSIAIVTIASCMVAVRAENIKSFEQPLLHLRVLMNEFKD